MCLYPNLIINPKYTKTAKNGGQVPPMPDRRVRYVPIGCGRCIECMNKKAREWQVRLQEEVKHNRNGKFITLTFSNEEYARLVRINRGEEQEVKGPEKKKRKRTKEPKKPKKPARPMKMNLEGYELDNWVATYAVRHFLESWRKKYKRSLRHWLVTELGHNGTENIHLHGIIWTDEPVQTIDKFWKYGFTWKGEWKHGKLINYVNDETVNYITKYVTKVDFDHQYYKPTILTSAGIGGKYDVRKNAFKGKTTDETYRTNSGHRVGLPIYYRNKAYSEQEREQLWLHKLDENVRYILKEKIDVKNGYEQYFRDLEGARRINKSLGYGSNERSWQRQEYEAQRRALMQEQRIAPTRREPAPGRAGPPGYSKDNWIKADEDDRIEKQSTLLTCNSYGSCGAIQRHYKNKFGIKEEAN